MTDLDTNTTEQIPTQPGKNYSILDWLLRVFKGTLVGIGFIMPGLSGGVMAVLFNLYEPLIHFLADIRKNFLNNFRFFLPVGIGGVIGVVAFSAVVEFAFEHYAVQFIWLFVGFIAGTFPSLFKTAGSQGRKTIHWVFMGLVVVLTYFFMTWLESANNLSVEPSFGAWVFSGILIGLGVVVPGMSPSNFLIYLDLYQEMASGIRQLDPGVIIPLGIGGLICVFAFAKLVSMLFSKAHAFMYHFIIGVVIGSTLVILPSGVSGWTIVVCAVCFVIGAAVSYLLSLLDEKNPRESLF